MDENNKEQEIAEEKDQESESDNIYSDMAEKNEEDSIPLDFDYYTPTDNASLKKAFLIAVISLCSILFIAGAIRTIDKRNTAEVVSQSESSYYDSYPGSPYADDTEITAKGTTTNGLEFTMYKNHVRITGFTDVLIPIDLSIPDNIKGVPVTEIDYYVFSYCALKSLTIPNPDCIFFDSSDDFPPVPKETAIIAPEGSDAQKIAEKYGNQFTASK